MLLVVALQVKRPAPTTQTVTSVILMTAAKAAMMWVRTAQVQATHLVWVHQTINRMTAADHQAVHRKA
jgi:hypothetical protein